MDEAKVPETGIVPVKVDAPLVASLTHEFDFEGKDGLIEIYGIAGKPLVETSMWRLVIAKYPSGQNGLVMIASKPEFNYLVEKQAHVLTTLQEMAAAEDALPGIMPHYGAFFPTMVQTMQTEEDEPRSGVFMGYNPAVSTYKQLVPLSVALAGKRVDLQTGLWMLGKSLKVLEFVHAIGLTVGFVDESNLLLETALHGVFILNWMDAIEESATEEDKKAEIKKIAEIVWRAVGGTEKSDPPYDEKVMSKTGYDEFVAVLKRLMSGDAKSAGDEMTALYEMADRIWARVDDPGGHNTDGKKRPFHEWVTYPLG
jgi:hypothetical protein